MNVIKHMEAAFLVALSLTAAASVAVDSIQPAQAAAPARVQAVATTAGVPVSGLAPCNAIAARPTTREAYCVSLQMASCGSESPFAASA